MKKMKKMASFLLAMLMALALAVPAMAADQGGDTSGGTATTPTVRTYDVYQIFTGTYHDEEGEDNTAPGEVLSNIKWGKNGTQAEGTTVDKTVLDELANAATKTNDRDKLEIITKYLDTDTTPYATGVTANDNGMVVVENMPSGYYLIMDNSSFTPDSKNPAMSYVVEVLGNELQFKPKVSGVPTVDKKILDTAPMDTNEAGIGEEVNYEITGSIPEGIEKYNQYYYVFRDTLSKGLTFKADSIKVEVVNGETAVDVTSYFYKNVGDYSETDGTSIKIGIQDVKALALLDSVDAITSQTKIVVTYTATVNEDAVIGSTGNPNDVELDYSNDPNNSGNGSTPPPENPDEPTPPDVIGTTPKEEVITYVTGLTILKVDGNGDALAGAEFTLEGANLSKVLVSTSTEFVLTEDGTGTHWKLNTEPATYTTTAPLEAGDGNDYTAEQIEQNHARYASLTDKYRAETKTTTTMGKVEPEATTVKGTSDANGIITFTGLGAGEYTIIETSTPNGYNTAAPITFIITYKGEGVFESDNENVKLGSANVFETTVVNNKGATLPETGGIGTTIFYVVGGALVIGAVVLLVTKKRMSNIEE